MEPLFSILTFPQYYRDGKLYFNIVVLPRNINLFKPIGNLPPFAETDLSFDTKIINSLDGLPVTTSVTNMLEPVFDSEMSDKFSVIQEIISNMEQNDRLKVSDDSNENKDSGFDQQKQLYKNISIRKYLPLSYRNAFNFTNPKTRFALTDDKYECIIKNKDKKQSDTPTNRDYISWGKLVAFILRNPLLAEKAGLIYKSHINLDEGIFEKGGWLYHDFGSGCEYAGMNAKVYSCRIPSLKRDRQLFAPVLFPVKDIAENNVTYDSVMQEAIIYNDGFGKIVHANQPINQDLLQEKDSSNPPLKDIGIQLGWDDEQLTIWGNRQLKQQDEITNLPIDAPLGVFGYRIDVKKPQDERWFSQSSIYSKQHIDFASERIITAETPFELSVEVHPSSHGDTLNEGFWLPMYYTSWSGKAMVIPDKDAKDISNLYEENILFDANAGGGNAINTIPKRTFNPYAQDQENKINLLYGEDYQFRIRFMDISGGGPSLTDTPLNGGQSPIAKAHFTRNVAAGSLKISNMEEFYSEQTGEVRDMSILENFLGEEQKLFIKRPELGYPSVVFTGKYADAVSLLKDKIRNLQIPQLPEERNQYSVSLPDPDVNSFKITVEVKSLEMDNVLSEKGNDNYIIFSEKIFEIPSDKENENYDLEAEIDIIYKDFDSIELGVFHNEGSAKELVLPTSRNLRITLTPIVDFADNDYAADFVKEGKKTIINSFKEAAIEKDLLSPINGGLRAFYLQPERLTDMPASEIDKIVMTKAKENGTSVELQRLAEQLQLSVRNLTLEGQKGNRVQFGVSHQFLHSLSPESGSVTFSSVKELFNHWIIALDFSLLRDWSWDALQPDSFTIEREIFFDDLVVVIPNSEVGSIQMKDIANMNMLQGEVNRENSRILFLDAIDPKQLKSEFPKEIIVNYKITPNFKEEYKNTVVPKDNTVFSIKLPITTIPHQLPKLVSAGLAMTPYQYDEENYRSSSPRQKFMWFEFDAPPSDPDTTYYARILAYAPDPYLCNIDMDILSDIPEDLPFAINEEKIREIIPGMENDFAGIGIMQEMIPETNTNKTKTYLLPLPQGLHADSDELFGFFTYEIRIGYKKEIWTTAQARYGRPLKVNGVQHPVPELTCNVYRIEKNTHNINNQFLEISAPFAIAVHNGKNVSSNPPNTSLWYLLYTQVMQADGRTFRNILIDSGPLNYIPKKMKNDNHKKQSGTGIRLGKAIININEIEKKIQKIGLVKNNNLSVLVVEMFPLDNQWKIPSHLLRRRLKTINENKIEEKIINPLTDLLGEYRVYRNSILTQITEICCVNCD